MKNSFFLIILVVYFSCSSSKKDEKTESPSKTPEKMTILKPKNFDIQGHRGARGLLPENSLIGFRRAIELGVNTLEMDVCITSDKQVIVSHDPYMSSKICLDTKGNIIPENEQLQHNIYEMTFEEVKNYNCGSLMHQDFISQGKIQTTKPLLSDVFRNLPRNINPNVLNEIKYNIEIKSSEEYDNIFHPEPAEFSELVYKEIDENIEWEKVNIQSFDFRILRYFREKYPHVQLAVLIEDNSDWKSNIESLGFTPDIYSCNFNLLSKEIVEEIQAEGMLVIPWTINDPDQMIDIVQMGVNGIITDYPDKAIELFR